MARLYADENVDYPVVEQLRQLGHDALTVHEAGQAQQRIPNEAILAFAIAQSRAVLTYNRRHVIRLHRLRLSHSGITVCTKGDDSAALAARIDHALANVACPDGQLLRVNLRGPP
jgi:hypothetical protein